MAEQVKREFYPLATNILKLQDYSSFFDLNEIILFEWFVVKAQSFHYKEFFYSNRRISDEVRIKDDRLTKILGRFQALGIIQVEIKGFPLVKHFTVDFASIIEILSDIYKFTENSKLLPISSKILSFYRHLLTESSKEKNNKKNINKNNIKEELRIEEEEKGPAEKSAVSPLPYDLISKIVFGQTLLIKDGFSHLPLLENALLTTTVGTIVKNGTHSIQLKEDDLKKIEMYVARLKADPQKKEKEKTSAQKEKEIKQAEKQAEADRKDRELSLIRLKTMFRNVFQNRTEMYNEEVRTRKRNGRIKTPTKLAFLKRFDDSLYELSKLYEFDQIQSSFLAYADEILQEGPASGVKKIIPYFLAKDDNDEFDVVYTYLDRYNINYARA